MKHLVILLFTAICLGACVGHGYKKDKEYSNKVRHRSNNMANAEVAAHEHIDILKATKNPFQAGIVGNAGTTYSFDLYTKLDGITFGKVWLGERKTFAINAVDVETSLRPKSTKNRTLSFKITDPNNNEAVGVKLPIQFQGEAVIQYIINDQSFYLIVNNIEELPIKIND